jgi:cell division protein FtsB
MKTIFAVHHVFDCLGYNEHHYFNSYAEAFELLVDIKKSIKENETIDETYNDTSDEFHVLHDNGLERVYIQEINL